MVNLINVRGISKNHWRKGFGSEAASAVRDWAFMNTEYDCLYSYMKYTNFMCEEIKIREERISSAKYINFLKRTDLGSQYPKERFEERISKLVGMKKANDVMQYNHMEWTEFTVQ